MQYMITELRFSSERRQSTAHKLHPSFQLAHFHPYLSKTPQQHRHQDPSTDIILRRRCDQTATQTLRLEQATNKTGVNNDRMLKRLEFLKITGQHAAPSQTVKNSDLACSDRTLTELSFPRYCKADHESPSILKAEVEEADWTKPLVTPYQQSATSFQHKHQTAAEAMQLRKDMTAASKSSISKNEAAVKAALANVLFLAKEDLLNSFL
ncbi:hypothetical protein DPMN_127466 [Dreissena polymorpha]|uniref:Uncharacterized protein n=1 Tax=Dreissena polymorpha TaxID=45954 RepID=A0A9D4GXP4_DREPO|nr:hypothetical protein DPMN_127466 [Dreissena polymorpha]